MKWIKVLIQCFLLSAADCGSHSLEFLSTGRVQPGDQPQFEQLTVFDGVPISYCDSLTRREEFKPSLESRNLPEDCDEARYNILESLREIPEFLNNSVYIVQRRRGCILSVPAVVSAFDVWAVNGVDFMSFDPESQTWTSHSPSAVPLMHHWNNNSLRNFAFRWFIREQCPEMIQKIKLRSTHQNTELRVFAKPTVNTDQALLRCHVRTTDKSLSSVHLIGDGASKASWITTTGPVPSEDGSVILRLTAGISLRQNTKYGCMVQTEGRDIIVYWDWNTLDGRHLYAIVDWKTLVVGFLGLLLTSIILSCAFISLLHCVHRMPSHTSKNHSRRMEHTFTKIKKTIASPDLQNIIAACTQVTQKSRDWKEWSRKIMSADKNYYDPEFFAHQLGSLDNLIVSHEHDLPCCDHFTHNI